MPSNEIIVALVGEIKGLQAKLALYENTGTEYQSIAGISKKLETYFNIPNDPHSRQGFYGRVAVDLCRLSEPLNKPVRKIADPAFPNGRNVYHNDTIKVFFGKLDDGEVYENLTDFANFEPMHIITKKEIENAFCNA